MAALQNWWLRWDILIAKDPLGACKITAYSAFICISLFKDVIIITSQKKNWKWERWEKAEMSTPQKKKKTLKKTPWCKAILCHISAICFYCVCMTPYLLALPAPQDVLRLQKMV